MRISKRKLMEVALSIRKRHFQNLLDEARHLRREITAARRSRRRRAQLIQLARRHSLLSCLQKLKPKATTLQPGNGGLPYIAYDHRIVRSHLAMLKAQCREIHTEWKRLKAETAKPIVANLKTLLEETELAKESPLEVRWIVDNITLDDVWIGDIEVMMNLETFSVHAFNKSVDTGEKNGYQHPHVSSDGHICWNGYDSDAEAYHMAGDFLAVKDMIENLLRTYNPHSPYISLEDWENGPSSSCNECGERYSDDELAYSERYRDYLCPNCRCYCDECEDYVSEYDYDSDMNACKRCVEMESDVCALCLERFWHRELTAVEMLVDGKMETVPCCETCKEEYESRQAAESNEKEENELEPERNDHADAACLLAPAVALSADSQ